MGAATMTVQKYVYATGSTDGAPFDISSGINFGNVDAGDTCTPYPMKITFSDINTLQNQIKLGLTSLGSWGSTPATVYGYRVDSSWGNSASITGHFTAVSSGGASDAANIVVGYATLTTYYVWLDVQPDSSETTANTTIAYTWYYDYT